MKLGFLILPAIAVVASFSGCGGTKAEGSCMTNADCTGKATCDLGTMKCVVSSTTLVSLTGGGPSGGSGPTTGGHTTSSTTGAGGSSGSGGAAGAAGAGSCTQNGLGCDPSNPNCCGGTCDATKLTCCSHTSCVVKTDCCAGTNENFNCTASTCVTCQATGATCVKNSDCCNGTCDATSGCN